MTRQIEGLPREASGFEASGSLSSAELDDVMNTFDATICAGYGITLLIEIGSGMVEDSGVDETRFRNRLSARGRTRRLAFVGESKWRARVDEFARFVGCDTRMFPPGRRDKALTWLLKAPFLKGARDAG